MQALADITIDYYQNVISGHFDPGNLSEAQKWQDYQILKADLQRRINEEYNSEIQTITDYLRL
jgi:hypothetical protein